MDRHDQLRTVRLIRKFADVIDGIDLSEHDVGDRFQLRSEQARVLILEGWASADEDS
jgi:hypothetical protein